MSPEKKKKLGLWLILVVFLVLLVGLVRFIHHRWRYAVTNAVFVETDQLIFLGFQRVNGRLLSVEKDEGEAVRTGEVLAKIDLIPYQARLNALYSQKEALKRRTKAQKILITRLKRELTLLEAKVQKELLRLYRERQALRAQAKGIEAEIIQLKRDVKRAKRLYVQKLIPKHQLEELETKLEIQKEAQRALEHRAQALAAAYQATQKELLRIKNRHREILEAQEGLKSLEAQMKALESEITAAKDDLSACILRSPIDGLVAKKFHVAGDVVGPGEPVLALVDPKKLYILVLLEETKLHGVEVGCEARVKIDAYPKIKFQGKVSEILPATAAKFALVPRDVSAGEFTKVAQRVPIKIRLTEGPVELLRVGLGGEVEIKRK